MHDIHRWEKRVKKVGSARSAYCKALHLAPHVGCAWGDASLADWQHMQLQRAHPDLLDSSQRLQTNAERLIKGMSYATSCWLLCCRRCCLSCLRIPLKGVLASWSKVLKAAA